MRTPFLILAGRPRPSTLYFADQLARLLSEDVFVILDTPMEESLLAAQAIYVSDAEARAGNFINANPFIKKTLRLGTRLFTCWRRARFSSTMYG